MAIPESEKLSATFDYSYGSFWDDVNTTPLTDVGHVLRRIEIARAVEEYSPSTALSVGSGFGEELLAVKTRNKNLDITCLDLSEAALERCEKLLGAKPVKGDVTAMPFEENYFGMTIALEVLEHVAEHEKGARELYRVTRPGGILIASVPHGKLTQEWIETGHLRHYTHEAFVALFKQAGFEFVRDLNNYRRLRKFYAPFKRVCFRYNQVLNLFSKRKREYVDRVLFKNLVGPVFLRLSKLEDGSEPGPFTNFGLFQKPAR